MLLAVSEAVLKIVAVVVEDVERLVLNFPTGPPAGGEFGDIVTAHLQVGDEAVAVSGLALRVDDLEVAQVTFMASLPSRRGTSLSQQ